MSRGRELWRSPTSITCGVDFVGPQWGSCQNACCPPKLNPLLVFISFTNWFVGAEYLFAFGNVLRTTSGCLSVVLLQIPARRTAPVTGNA